MRRGLSTCRASQAKLTLGPDTVTKLWPMWSCGFLEEGISRDGGSIS